MGFSQGSMASSVLEGSLRGGVAWKQQILAGNDSRERAAESFTGNEMTVQPHSLVSVDLPSQPEGSGTGGRLLEWWSSGRAKVSQLGLAVVSCKKVRSGRPYDADPSMPASGRLPRVGSATLTG
ncbi:hypothetical protein BHE74_00032713 [Ensete ventricosum]|nr:hypothetical protein BHE74_00032713 [Ensete ventricosum]